MNLFLELLSFVVAIVLIVSGIHHFFKKPIPEKSAHLSPINREEELARNKARKERDAETVTRN